MTRLYQTIKVPVEVEVAHFETLDDLLPIAKWCNGRIVGEKIAIDTLEGTMTASLGDYIIKGVKGEFYPCKPDVFRDTYTYPVVKGVL